MGGVYTTVVQYLRTSFHTPAVVSCYLINLSKILARCPFFLKHTHTHTITYFFILSPSIAILICLTLEPERVETCLYIGE
jgi:hypothetical protein